MSIDEFVTNYNDTIRENLPLPNYLLQENMGMVAKMFFEYTGEVPNFDLNIYGQIVLLGEHEKV